MVLTARENKATRARMPQRQRRTCTWAALLAAVTLAGCHRGGPSSGPTNSPGSLLSDGRQLTRSEVLLQVVGVSHGEVSSRLGPHRIESVTRYTITPLSSPKAGPDVAAGFRADSPVQPYENSAAWESAAATLEEKRSIELDGQGSLRVSNQNDHGYGIEAIVDREYLYMRLQNAPFVRRLPEGDEVDRLRAVAYEPGSALLETVASALYLSPPSETTRLGRPAWAVALSRQDGVAPRRSSDVPGKAWRGNVIVEAIEGQAVIDRQRGALLELKLSVRFQAARGPVPAGTPAVEGERVQVEAQHELHVVALGNKVEEVKAPGEWIEPPMRPRPTLDKQELLNGLQGNVGAGRP